MFFERTPIGVDLIDSISLHLQQGAQQLSSNPGFGLRVNCGYDKDPCVVVLVADDMLSRSAETPHENHLHLAPATVIVMMARCL